MRVTVISISWESKKKILTKGQNVCAVISVEAAVPDTIKQQYRVTDPIEITNPVNSIMKNCNWLTGHTV